MDKTITDSGASLSNMDARLLRIARRVVWWEAPEQALVREDDFLCRVMARGTLEDVRYVESTFGAPRLRSALLAAAPGVLDQRSWHYWHHRLGLGAAGPMPQRRFA
jgi:GAF domain-containing protein